MNILNKILNLNSASDLYKQMVEVAGEICRHIFETNKKVVVQGISDQVDISDLIGNFRNLLAKANIGDDCLKDDELLDLIKAFDQYVLEKNA